MTKRTHIHKVVVLVNVDDVNVSVDVVRFLRNGTKQNGTNR